MKVGQVVRFDHTLNSANAKLGTIESIKALPPYNETYLTVVEDATEKRWSVRPDLAELPISFYDAEVRKYNKDGEFIGSICNRVYEFEDQTYIKSKSVSTNIEGDFFQTVSMITDCELALSVAAEDCNNQ